MARWIELSLSALVAGLVGALAAPKMSAVYAPIGGGVTIAASLETEPQQLGQQVPPATQDAPLLDPALAARAKRMTALTTGLLGTWRLTLLTPALPTPAPRQVSGVMVVTEHVLSLTIHALPNPSDINNPSVRIQAGAHYWRIGPMETLETAAIIGHDNLSMQLALEPRLEPREYEVDLLARNLILRKRDGTRLEFERMDVQSFPPDAIRFIDAMRQGRNLDDLRNR